MCGQNWTFVFDAQALVTIAIGQKRHLAESSNLT